MKAIILNNVQVIPEVPTLGEIEERGLYAVSGYDHPVYAGEVTEYGEEEIKNQHDSAFFFTNWVGVRFYGIKTGVFAKEEEEWH